MTVKAYYLPRSLDEALDLLAQHGPELLVMAGGTLAMPLITKGISMPERVMGLRQVGLNYIRESGDGVAIGATTTLTQIVNYTKLPLISEAAHNVGGWAIRNMGTAGGNLFAPPPAGDLAVALLALDGQAVLARQGSQRVVPLAAFHTGFMATALQPAELLIEIRVPWPKGKTALLKHGRLHTNTPAIVSVAVQVMRENGRIRDARIALNAVGPHPLRARHAEAALVASKGDEAAIATAGQAAAQECEPYRDPIASEWYRRRMADVFVRRALAQVLLQETTLHV